ncbi:MAG TPA: hypothetical protein VFG83_05525 [Kofleriaceae bacterium]|nr:hypothetical protein [Kofleriaceae bacterium]
MSLLARTRTVVGTAGRWMWAENLALVIAGLVVAAGEVFAIRWIYLASFGTRRRISPSLDLPLGHAALWAFGLIGMVLSMSATYRLLRYGRLWLAVPLVLLVCLPLLVIFVGSLYASLIVAAIL